MSCRRTAAALVVLAVLTSACVGPDGEPGQSEHDAAVARLRAAADAEEGWLVVDVPVSHEGGGRSTWWLGPCDGNQRPATVTGYSGSDVAGDPGHWHVDDDRTVPCGDPTRTVTVDGRGFTFDGPVIDLGSGWVPLDSIDRVVVTDELTGARHELGPDTGTVTVDPCDGTTSWTATWFETVTFTRQSCLDTLASLPGEIVDLLPGGAALDRSDVRISGAQAQAITDTFGTLDEWVAEQLEVRTVDGLTTQQVWRGPCRELPGGDRAHTVADLHTVGTLTVRDRPCTGTPR